MSDSKRAGFVRRSWARLKAGALFLLLGGAVAASAQAQQPGDGDFEARAERLRGRVAELEANGGATAADALRELGVEPEGLGYWGAWTKWPNWCNWSNWSKWQNWGNWPNWCNW